MGKVIDVTARVNGKSDNVRAGLPPSNLPDPAMKPLRVLVAEDEAPLREILVEGLREEGFEVVPAVDGAQALELFRSGGPFDVLLLDEEMPKLTGRRVLGRLRAEGEDVAAILFSGNLELSNDERARLRVGPCLRKPISLAELSQAILRAVGRS